MPASALEQVPVVAPPKVDTALVSSLKCTYCHHDNHDTVECFILQLHLYNGQIKAGTVLPANFKLKPPQQRQQPLQHQHPYKGNYSGKSGNQSRNNNKDSRNGNHGNQGRLQERNKYHGRRNRDDDDNSDYGIVAFTTLDLNQGPEELSLTALESDHDPTWTVDSGCTRHVTSSPKWFKTLKPTAGKAITVGGNHQIPIKGTGNVEMKIKDIKGKERIIAFNDVLYTPDLKFNLISVRQTIGSDFKINFPNAKKCVLFFAHRIKFEAKTGDGKSLYQFQAKPTDSDQEAHVATSGTSDNVLLWRKRMGHPNFRIMQDLAKECTVTDMGLSNFDPKRDYFCSTCT
ncbi:Pol Polyprotein [Phytophthora cinnamomi]|uniref:Pol Polyprotein n=1 Tax=Phytophthora cinnamomi TaxID=4785 RepID=UPI00355A1006|nr:Pol Polyprotein [Phytophthora cinnamomi]